MKEKILLIDDEPEILDLLTVLLEDEGFEILKANNGSQGISLFKVEEPDLVITDVRMPNKTGLDVLRAVKEDSGGVDVIILTGQSDEATAIDCLRAGAYDYLLKPIEDLDLLITAVNRALQKRRLKQENRQLLKRLEEMAIRDPLTGLYNMRHFHTILDDEISRSERYEHTFCLLFLDIDHFKQVNDTYGHLYGDYILKELGGIMGSVLRNTTRLFRYGGEEFVIILPETSLQDASQTIDRLMKKVRHHIFREEDNEVQITISIGVAAYPQHATRKNDLIQHADMALYEAKSGGRNKAVFSKSEQE